MRLVINGRFLSQVTTGVQRYARELVAAIDRDHAAWPGVMIEMLVPRGDFAVPAYENIEVRTVGRLQGHAWEQFELPLHCGGDLLFCPGNTAPLVSLLARRPVVVTVHDLSYRYFPSAYHWSFRALYNLTMPAVMRFALRVITVSDAEKVQILRYYPAAAPLIAVVPNGGLPTMTVAAPLDLSALQPYVLYVGSFSKRKNFDAVLAVAGRLLAERPHLNAVLVGGSPNIFESVGLSEHGHNDRMIFPGQINATDELVAYYAAAEVLIFPSFYESSGLPPVEAMATGCPVVVSDIPAHRERCGEAALYCDPGDVADIHRAAAEVLDDAAFASALRRKGLERAKLFTWEGCAAKTMTILQEAAVLAKARSSRNKSLDAGKVGPRPI